MAAVERTTDRRALVVWEYAQGDCSFCTSFAFYTADLVDGRVGSCDRHLGTLMSMVKRDLGRPIAAQEVSV